MKRYLTCIVLIFCLNNICSAQVDTKSNAIQVILDSKELGNYLHSELPSRTPLYLLGNKFVDERIEVSIKGKKVLLLQNEPDSIQNYIQFLNLEIKKDKVEFELYYKIENMYMIGSLKLVDGLWRVNRIKEIIEF